jgi:hypothetical protein
MPRCTDFCHVPAELHRVPSDNLGRLALPSIARLLQIGRGPILDTAGLLVELRGALLEREFDIGRASSRTRGIREGAPLARQAVPLS